MRTMRQENTLVFRQFQGDEREKLVMMPQRQEDLTMHGHDFFELAYITGGTAVQEMLEFVDGSYRTGLTLKDFCERRHYSLSYVSRRFKQETGLCVRDYVQKIRVEKSCELLEGSDMRVSEVARAVGYEDIKFFNQVFKKRMQVSPREYRRLCRGSGNLRDIKER